MRKLAVYIQWLSMLFTVFVAVYMARPWGDNYAYQSIGGYIVLAVFMLFAVSPYVGFLRLMKMFQRTQKLMIVFLSGASLIAVLSLYLYFDTAFIHMDAQGGLIFFFLPIYQWLAAIILLGICFLLQRFGWANA